MRIGDIVHKTGLSISNIRYYEKLEIIRNIERGEDGKRVYSEGDLKWIQFLAEFKKTQIPLSLMKKYASLYYDGDSTIDERIQLLKNHHMRLIMQLESLQNAIEFVEHKIEFYHHKKENLEHELSCL